MRRIANVTEALRMGPVKFFVAVLYRPEVEFVQVQQRLEGLWGKTDLVSEPYPFDVTEYYKPEMGEGLLRRFVVFEHLFPPEYLRVFKLECNRLELLWLNSNGDRTVNLDPGYIDYFKLVLASNKPSGKKIAVGDGVWLDLNLLYEKGEWIALPWTFPDFRDGRYSKFLNKMRAIYKGQMRKLYKRASQV